MYRKPEISPWGRVQVCDILCPGVFLVSTASHGGTMVSKEVAAFLSPAAKKCGFRQGGYLCFEEDTQEEVVFRELLDKRLWKIPDRIRNKEAYEENINQSLREHNPAYWRARTRGRENARPAVRQTRPGTRHDNRFGPTWPEVMKGGFELCPMCRFRKIYPK